MKMVVGANYPWCWNTYGTYFGNPNLGAWPKLLGDNLSRLRDTGVEIVRLFLYGNAWTVGTFDGKTLHLPRETNAVAVEQWTEALEQFEKRRMRVLPSLLDFKAVLPYAPSKGQGGRTALTTDGFLRAQFFEQFLEPLLDASREHADAVFAWEVMNEPRWAALNPLAEATEYVAEFLHEGARHIESAGFESTIGHRFSWDLESLPTGTLRSVHYYPRRGWRAWLPLTEQPLKPHAETNAILGEFATTLDGSQGDLWPEVPDSLQADPRIRVLNRLRAAEAKGYQCALAWPDLQGAPFGPNDPLKFSNAVLAGISDYTKA